MRLQVHEDQLTKVTVSGDQNPSFPVGDGEDFVVWQARRVLAANSADIMPAFLQVGANASIGALIEQESHALAVADVAFPVAAASASFRCRERR